MHDLVRAVLKVEEDSRRAEKLLRISRRVLLDESEWRDLSLLVWRSREAIPSHEAQIRELLLSPGPGHDPDTVARQLLEELQQRLANMQVLLYSNELRWEDAVRRVEATLPVEPVQPVGAGPTAVVESRIVPGPALGSRFENGYPAGARVNWYCGARYSHVPDLAQSVLTNASGRILYSGLRHGFVCAGELNNRLLAGISDDELKALVGDLLTVEEEAAPAGQARAGWVAQQCASIRGSREGAALFGALMVNQARRNQSRELAAAALVADPEKCGRGLDGQSVDLDLFCISVLRPGDFRPWVDQARALNRLGESGRVDLTVCGPDGALHRTSANVKVRQFVLSTTGERIWSAISGFSPCDDVRALLGRRDSREPGPDIKARIETMQSRVAALRDEVEWLESQRLKVSRTRRTTDLLARALSDRLARARDGLRCVEKDACTLKDAGEQLKKMWAPLGDWPVRVDAYPQVAARLALIARLMGGTPALSCAAGCDLTRQLDPEVKFLATAADNNHGYLPSVDEGLQAWRQAREAFRPQ